ncbi:MAG: FAD-dependent oxidoreductase [Alphaproteobacteria bacterium]|nr:FAD-dependent oxidoreductase [Alphaproteobacteria bacterium]
MAQHRALIVGGSVGGLFAANLLRASGWDAVVFERNPEELTGRGAGISTHPQLHDIMRRLGIAFDDSMGITVRDVVFLDRDGRAYVERDTHRVMSSWGRIFRSLRDMVPEGSYRLGMSLTRVEQDAGGVTAIFADGTRERGDLLVGADGSRSTVREQFLPGHQPEYAGYVAWRAMLDERDIPPAIHAELFHRYTYCLPPGELFLAYPVPGRNNETQAGQRAYNIVWYRPTTPERLADFCTDAAGKCHGTAIAPPLLRPDVIAWAKAQARALVAPQVAEIFERDPRPFFQAIFDLDAPQIAFGRVALLGDAAFVARPHPGAGTTKAALDAAKLADSIAAHGLERGLTAYQREQKAFGSGIVALGRREGAFLTDWLKPPTERTYPWQTWDIEELMHSHNSRSAEVRKVLDASRNLGAA